MIDLNPSHLDTVTRILAGHVPDCEVRAFGSRVTWTAKDYSDLDLAVVGERALDSDVLRRLKEAFEESDLPFRVDVLDWHAISSAFRKVIEKEYEVVQKGKQKGLGMAYDAAPAVLRDLLLTTKDGDWGKESAASGFVPYRVIRGADFPSVRVGDTSSVPLRYLSESTVHRRTLRPDDILLETAGGSPGRPTGRSLLITKRLLSSLKLPTTCASFARFLRVDPSKAVPGYVYWHLQYLYASGQMEEHQVQHTGVARFQYTKFAQTEQIPLPDPDEQRAIAHILGTLDDKIELNRRMNETLEAMARALFKSWFVDFDPVRAKAEGRDPGLPKPVADLFPDSFEDSELGEIPKGWEVKALGDLLDLAYGKALKAEDRRDGNIPVYGSNGQVGWHDERLVTGPGIVVGRKGNPGIATWVTTDFFPIDTTFYVVPKASCRSLAFLFHVLRTHDLASLGADSAVPGLNRNLAYMSLQVLPPAPLRDRFDHLASALSQRVHQANDEGRSLATLRDTLLPRLISGELRVRQNPTFDGAAGDRV